MNWRIIRTFPKYAIVLGVIIASTAMFGLWWYLRQPAREPKSRGAGRAEAIAQKAQSLPENLQWLALVNGDLYNLETGDLLFPNWLRGTPQGMFYHPGSNRLLVQAENGIIRFGLDGSKEAVMAADAPPAFTRDGKQALWVKNGDIWVAEPDWSAFKFVNERQVTRYGQFHTPYFQQNVLLASESACLINMQKNFLRVDLRTGDLKEVKLPINTRGKGRSPDQQVVLEDDGRQIFVLDVNQAEAAMFPRAGRVNDCQWLNNDRCAYIMAGKAVGIYDRKKKELATIAQLPFHCSDIGQPSPDGRYAICGSQQGLLLLDAQEKRIENLNMKLPRHVGWANKDTLIFSREVPDMKLRGTWLRTVGQEERMACPEPYLVGYDKVVSIAALREADKIVFFTREALMSMDSDGSDLREVARPKQVGGLIQPVRKWGE